MNTNVKKLSTLLVAVILASACGNQLESPTVQKETRPSAQTASPAEQKPNILNITTKLNEPAFGGVDSINGVTSPKSGTVIPITGDKIEIAGNYVDDVKKDVAAGVLVVIDNKSFVTTYGGERPDIAKALNNPKYLKSQFYASIPTAELGKGQHDIKIRVIANDTSGYYESNWSGKIDIK